MSDSMHLIDGDGKLAPEEELVRYLAQMVQLPDSSAAPPPTQAEPSDEKDAAAVLHEIGSSYHMVGIFGGQSSGKSTLLNLLFQTQFQTLEETVRRGQTTLGAFMARARMPQTGASLEEPLFVVDFEGTDGLEHGDNQSLDRQLSLFGLCMADTLIINMWAVDVGRFNAANLSLLRTIFEVNLHLFSHENYAEEEKPTLLIVVRDFVEDNTEPSLVTLNKSFAMIWEGLRREGKFADRGIDALFRLRFFFLPHYKLQQDAFGRSLVALRDMFTNPHSADYLFHRRTMFRGVPLESLPAYLTNCWTTIQASKDLDIPTQREMLARHRCAEVQVQELNHMRAFCDALRRRLDDGALPASLSQVLSAACVERLAAYEQQTKLYDAEVVSEYGLTLRRALARVSVAVLRTLSEDVAAVVMRGVGAPVHAAVAEALEEVSWAARSTPFMSEVPHEPPHDTATSAQEQTTFPSARQREPHAITPAKEEETTKQAVHHAEQEEDNRPTPRGLPSEMFSREDSYRATTQTQHVMNNRALHALTVRGYRRIVEGVGEVRRSVAANPPAAHLYAHFAALVSSDEAVRMLVMEAVESAVYAKLHCRLRALAESAAETMQRGFERALTHGDDGGVRFFATANGLQRAVAPAMQAGLVLLDCLLYFRLGRGGEAGGGNRDTAAAAEDAMMDFDYTRAVSGNGVIELANSPAEQRFVVRFFAIHIPPRYPYGVDIAQPRHAPRAPESTPTTDTADQDRPRTSPLLVNTGNTNTENNNNNNNNNSDNNSNNVNHNNHDNYKEENSVPADRVLLSPGALQQAYDAFKRQSEFSTQLHMRSIESNRTRLPAWVIPALVILGWNEALYVLRSPTLLIILLSVLLLFGRDLIRTQWQILHETAPTSIRVPLEMALKWLGSALTGALVGTDAPAPARAQEGGRDRARATAAAAALVAAAQANKPAPPMEGPQRYFSFSHSTEVEPSEPTATATQEAGLRHRGIHDSKSMLVEVSHVDPHAHVPDREGSKHK